MEGTFQENVNNNEPHKISNILTYPYGQQSNVSLVINQMTVNKFDSIEQTGSFWITELYDMWPLDCSAWEFLSIWQVRVLAGIYYLVRLSVCMHACICVCLSLLSFYSFHPWYFLVCNP